MQYFLRAALSLMALLSQPELQAKEQADAGVVLAIQDALSTGDLDGAAQRLTEALEHLPSDGGLLNLRGILHARRNEMAEARSDFKQAVAMAPGLIPAWQNLARACQQVEDVTCAVESWQHVLKSRAGEAEAHRSLAWLYQRRGQPLDSLRELVASKQEDPLLRAVDLSALGRQQEAKVEAAKAAQQHNLTEGDLSSLKGALDSPQNAAIVVELIEELDGRGAASVTSLRRLVVAYEQLHRPKDASRLLERVSRSDPNQVADLLELARLAEEGKRYEAALGYLAHARDLEPRNGRIHFLFGLVAGELDLPIEAKRSLKEALALEPENANYHYAMGTVILKTRDASAAVSHFEAYVKALPADARGHYALGLAQLAAVDYAKAKEQLAIAAKDSRLAGSSEYHLGRIARLEGDDEEADRRLRKSIQLMPQFSEAHTELGRLALRRGNVEAARLELEQAIRLAPDSFQANEQLLILFKRTQDTRAAKQSEILKKLDEERSRRAELMVRTIEIRP